MRAITLMYDSLNRNYLSPYGGKVDTPNFDRLAKKAVTYDNFYCGSMPCIPARREVHTGRYNFLHRSWGPIEPFDDSMPEILSNNGICTQFVSDHCHYWQDGGCTYHERYSAFEFVRGQEGDEWKAEAEGFKEMGKKRFPRRQDPINRQYTRDENCCHARCFEKAEQFIENNFNQDDWHLHLEYFDPHEPFDCPDRFKKMITDEELTCDWATYAPVSEQDADDVRQIELTYRAVIKMVDEYLGRLLDLFDKYNLWKDTMLILFTDHGYMLGEHGYMAKNYMPCYQELVNLPFFVYNPEEKKLGGQRCSSLVQTIDIAPTMLDFFNQEIPTTMQGKSLIGVAENNKEIHDSVLFGYFGKHINVTDGKYVYMRAARDNKKLYEYTLMPTHLAKMFDKEELKLADKELYSDFKFAYNVPMLRILGNNKFVPDQSHHQYDYHMKFGDLLFDVENDYAEENNIVNNEKIVKQMNKKLIKNMKWSEAPREQYERMGFTEEEVKNV